MSSDSPFQAAKAGSTHSTVALIMVVLALAAGALHYYAMQQQKALQQTVAAAERQYAVSQRVAMLVAQHENTHDDGLLTSIKEAASTALANHDPLVARFANSGAARDETLAAEDALNTLRGLVDHAYSYSNDSEGQGAKDLAADIAMTAQSKIPDQWLPAIATYSAAAQKPITFLGYGIFACCGLLLLALAFEATALFSPALRHIAAQKESIEQMSATDMLTGLYNRMALFKVVGMLISGAKRHKQELAVLAVDIDELKKINDGFGRAGGDAAIRAVANIVRDTLRNSDVMGRIGGGEFAIFLPSTDEYRASLVAEKLRVAVADLPFSLKEKTVMLCISIGVGDMQPQHKTPDDVLRSASAALTKAKDDGRNRVVLCSTLSGAQPTKAESRANADANADNEALQHAR
ncbi:MAG: GGDEF domain-containing protein [Micavibrio sp.]|nr:GGDEF domain-containing protein [Micavibrio sp.]